MNRLNAKAVLPATVRSPRFAPESHDVGIVHIGLGAFHRAHQSVYTDEAIERSGGHWRTIGVSLRGRDVPEQLNPQDGRYTLLVRGAGAPVPRVLGNIAGVCHAPSDPERVLRHIARPLTRIVSLTITEKGYGLERGTGGLDINNPAIAHDLAHAAGAPQSALGFIVQALARRQANGAGPVTVLSCDNFPGNGQILRHLTLKMAQAIAPESLAWIEKNTTFPSTMVDRITPATAPDTLAQVQGLIGFEDRAVVEAEAFTQWVVEDDFAAGRPDWEAGGACFVGDVTPYEEMKLRMLNGSHSMIAYAGYLAGHRYVRDVMTDARLRRLVARHLHAAAASLGEDIQTNLDAYADTLLERFSNPAIAHETYQIAMDGTQKLPQRIFAAGLAAMARGQALDAFAFATAAWMRYALGRSDSGATYALRDPREGEIARVLRDAGTAEAVFAALCSLPGLMPDELAGSSAWRSEVTKRLATMLGKGMPVALDAESAA